MRQNWNFIGFFLLSIIFLHSCGSSDTNQNDVDSEVPVVATGGDLDPNSSGKGYFEVPSGTVSFLIHATSPSSIRPQFTSLKDPDGNEIMTNLGEFAWRSYGYSNVLIPISSNYSAKQGVWSYSVSNYSQLSIGKRTIAISSVPTIKVQPYITGTTYTSDNISSALTIMKNIYSTNGVILDVLETITLSESKYSQVSYDFTNSVTSEMASKGLADRVNLFFISDYTDASYLGNSAGIPGSQGLAGSHNGVLISLKAHKNGDGSLKDQLLGETAGHEMGHFLGLFHPSESNGILFDPITDTPQCPSSKNTNNDSNLTAEECGQEYGADNLMFWDAWDNGNQDNLTAGQVYVLKRALIAK